MTAFNEALSTNNGSLILEAAILAMRYTSLSLILQILQAVIKNFNYHQNHVGLQTCMIDFNDKSE